jgi:hypothetical protein
VRRLFVFTGTAANAGARKCVGVPQHYLPSECHIQTDDTGPEFSPADRNCSWLEAETARLIFSETKALPMRQNEFHSHKPGVISIAQA